MDRFERQRRFFGAEGQDRLRSTRVLIVGAGGLGSHIVQQLAYLGAGQLIVVDPDVLDETNRNRLVGAWTSDPLGKPKVAIAHRLVAAIDPGIEIVAHQCDLRDAVVEQEIRNADWIFGCVDNDGARLLLTQRCAEARRPYVDLATEIYVSENQTDWGGRVCVAMSGRGCLYCLGLLSQEDIQTSLADDAERRDRKAIYGIEAGALQGSGPAVVYLNGIIASLGVAEFAAAATGLRAARPHLEYRGTFGLVSARVDPPEPGCPYCISGVGTE
ncbi:MAG: ThiF family adenylyltransferase [Planctomycetes bacterium]|nr:ThiF family adenylyltransferase [Planctomycetota bacterium]